MAATVVWSVASRVDRRNIYSYLEDGSPAAAVSIDERIVECVGQLLKFPRIGRAGRVRGTRELVISGTPYIVVYRIARDQVRVMRVFHGAQRWPRSLGR